MTDRPKRKSPRLQAFDYSQNGAYFVTICTRGRKCVLGQIVGEGLCALPKTQLSDIGKVVETSILFIAEQYETIHVDAWTIMPNHVHLLIRIADAAGGRGDPPLQDVIGRMKSYTTHVYGKQLWQRSFHDHIIRGGQDYLEIWEYIENNPLKWKLDKFYCE